MRPEVTGFFDTTTSSITYVVADPATRRCAVIDPVLDYDARNGRTSTEGVERLTAFVHEQGLSVDWVLDTHVHADHMTGLPAVQRALGGRSGIGGHVGIVQRTFRDLYGLDSNFPCDGRQYDHLFVDDQPFHVGAVAARALHIPGHTPACVAYVIGDAVFVGDALLMPDFGTARCDFPGGNAATLYHSVQRLLALPDDTRMFVAHDYGPGGREIAWETTVAAQRQGNVHVHQGIAQDDFVRLRVARDATLALPALMLAAIQVNIRAGALPEPQPNGRRYLKIPLNTF